MMLVSFRMSAPSLTDPPHADSNNKKNPTIWYPLIYIAVTSVSSMQLQNTFGKEVNFAQGAGGVQTK